MKALKILVLGSFAFVLMLMFGNHDSDYVSTAESSCVETYSSDSYSMDLSENLSIEESHPVETEPVYSDMNQTAPMPEEVIAEEDLLGKWIEGTDPDEIKVVHFYTENNQLMYRYCYIVPGNSIGMNLANEVTEWELGMGIVTVMENQGNIYCQRGTDPEIAVSFYYGFDGSNVMYDQEDGTAYYREF